MIYKSKEKEFIDISITSYEFTKFDEVDIKNYLNSGECFGKAGAIMVEAFSELFPYWTKRQVERILNNLIKKGAIIKANYNEKAYDRTSWYAITQTVESIYANGEMDFTKRGKKI